MKKYVFLFIAAIAVLFQNNAYAGYSAEYKDEVLSQIIAAHSLAVVTEDCELRESPNTLSKKTGELKRGAVVEVLKDSSEKWYNIRHEDENVFGWVHVKYLDIQKTPKKSDTAMTKEHIEAFANIMSFPSGTKYFIWGDISRQQIHVFEKVDGKYSLIKSFICASGKNSTPTTRGFFSISDRGKWFYSRRFDSGAMYWTRFNETYLFHSVAMDKNKNIKDGTLGERCSNGCIRLNVKDAEWIYNNIPRGTSVFIH